MRRTWLFVCASAIVLAGLALVSVAGAASGSEAASSEPAPDPSPSATPTLTVSASPATLTSSAPTVLTARLGIAGATLQLSRKAAAARIISYHPPCAIHGTNDPWLLKRFPRDFSHGCTRLASANAIWLYDHAPIRTPVWSVP